jgi:3-hydroxyisobutyrate dehydrogenase-like beta-hydroxyacid dehydrogenase
MGRIILRCDQAGHGQVAKICGNLLLAIRSDRMLMTPLARVAAGSPC